MSKEYRAYLLRLTRNENDSHWRVTLKDAHSDKQVNFATEHEMLLFLMRYLAVEHADLDEFAAPNNINPQV